MEQDWDAQVETFRGMWQWGVLAVLVIAGAVIGLLLSQALTPQPKIGIVRLYDVIDYYTAPSYLGPLQMAAERNDVVGVVILVDSPGGDATVSEELYFTILDLRKDKPVVASIERFGASGSYYAAVASNYIFARPAAQVGSIGVVASFPDEETLDEFTYVTGPFKGTGQSDMEFMRDIEAVRAAFATHVYDQRTYVLENMHEESRLDVLPPPDQVVTGQIWTGVRAYEIGLVDEIGSNEDAIKKAAELAGVRGYDVIDLYTLFIDQESEAGDYAGYSAAAPEEERPDWYTTGPWAEIYHLYVVMEDQ